MVYTIIIFLSIVVFGFFFQWNNYKKQERIREERKGRKQRRKYVRKSVCTSLGCCGSIENMSQDSTLFRAACGFVEGSIEQCYEWNQEQTVGV